MSGTTENKNISQIVIEQIQKMIMSGELKVGDKLPPERELTETLNIGRPALREALKGLEAIGFINKVHGHGNYVANNLENSLFKPLSLSFKLSNGKMEDILTLRVLVENHTVIEAAKNATEKDIIKLTDAVNNMITSENVDEKIYYDKLFHYEIAKISNNMLIINLLDSISYLMDAFIGKSVMVSLFKEHAIEEIYDEHRNIINAIKEKDPSQASSYMKKHLDNINLSSFQEFD
ncbi:MAG: FadR family transcriptional regulator [Dethiosulfatibacter sp.]|nr:FadR family transcriptional regulator [Dethiosulfatibacter sp.]